MAERRDAATPLVAPTVAFVNVGDAPTHATTFSCSLCGSRFSHGTMVCTSCPLNAGCDIIKCPNCGYQFPRSSKIVEWAKRMTRRVRIGASIAR